MSTRHVIALAVGVLVTLAGSPGQVQEPRRSGTTERGRGLPPDIWVGDWEREADADGGHAQLREAVREFYLHRVAEELDLTPAEATRVVPRMEAVLDAQRALATNRLRQIGRLSRLAREGADEFADARGQDEVT